MKAEAILSVTGPDGQKAITTTEAMRRLGVTKAMILRWIHAGEIGVVYEEPYPGGVRFWLSQADVDALVDKRAGA